MWGRGIKYPVPYAGICWGMWVACKGCDAGMQANFLVRATVTAATAGACPAMLEARSPCTTDHTSLSLFVIHQVPLSHVSAPSR